VIRGAAGRLVLAGWVGMFAGLAAAGSGPVPVRATSATTIRMHDFKFCHDDACAQDPSQGDVVTINAGDTVTWVWDESSSDPNPNCDSPEFNTGVPGGDCNGHTSTSVDNLWDSGTCPPQDGRPRCPYSVTFSHPGTYRYWCIYHGAGAPANQNFNSGITKMNGTVVVQSAGASPAGGASGVGRVPGLPDAGAE